MYARPAEFVREIEKNTRIDDLINDVLAYTWEAEVEHAAVKLEDGRRVIIRGGRDGIEFIVGRDSEDRPILQMAIADILIRVVRIFGHTHPRPTGLSDSDLHALDLLGQRRSYIVELWSGHRRGTLIRPKRDLSGHGGS